MPRTQPRQTEKPNMMWKGAMELRDAGRAPPEGGEIETVGENGDQSLSQARRGILAPHARQRTHQGSGLDAGGAEPSHRIIRCVVAQSTLVARQPSLPTTRPTPRQDQRQRSCHQVGYGWSTSKLRSTRDDSGSLAGLSLTVTCRQYADQTPPTRPRGPTEVQKRAYAARPSAWFTDRNRTQRQERSGVRRTGGPYTDRGHTIHLKKKSRWDHTRVHISTRRTKGAGDWGVMCHDPAGRLIAASGAVEARKAKTTRGKYKGVDSKARENRMQGKTINVVTENHARKVSR